MLKMDKGVRRKLRKHNRREEVDTPEIHSGSVTNYLWRKVDS